MVELPPSLYNEQRKVSTQHCKAKVLLEKEAQQISPPPLTNSLIGSEHYDIKLTWYSEFTNSIRPHGG